MNRMIFQKFIVGTGDYLSEAIANGVGGVIFFTKDIQSEEQFVKLIKSIKEQSIIKPFLSIDQEGGRVERTENIHERYLSPRYAFRKGELFLRSQTRQIAKELLSYGINLNFAPCADVNTNPNNPIIGERAFSNITEDVSAGVKIVVDEYLKNGIIPCLKHFPGHGDASKDSHLSLPQIDLSLEDMVNYHIKPFKDNINVPMIMIAHLHCVCFDKTILPSSLSQNVVGYLRKSLNYSGVVITDDMVMRGVQDYGAVEACIKAIEAGVDMFIYRDANEVVKETITGVIQEVSKSTVLQKLVEESDKRIQKLKKDRL